MEDNSPSPGKGTFIPAQLWQQVSRETTYSWEGKTKINAIHPKWIRSLLNMPRSLLTLYLEGIHRKHWADQEQSLLHQEVFLINRDLAKLLIRNTLTNSAGQMLAASSIERHKSPRGRWVAGWSWWQRLPGAVDGEDFTGHRDWVLLRGVCLSGNNRWAWCHFSMLCPGAAAGFAGSVWSTC